MSERFLITGGQGFIGAWIARALIAENTPVMAFDRTPDNSILSQVLEPDELEALERSFGDVCDTAKVLKVCQDFAPTHIIHLAGLQVPTCRTDPLLGAKVNVIGTLNVFEAAKALGDQVEMVVYASSAAVVGKIDEYEGRVPDETYHVPRTHYGVFKTANEGNARVYYEDHGISSVGLRPFTVYGVGREVGVTSGPTQAIKAAVLRRDYTVIFKGPTSFVFCEDLALMFIRSARSSILGSQALNIRGQVDTVENFLQAIHEICPDSGSKLECEGGILPFAYDFDESGLEDLLGPNNVPRTSIHDGIERTVGLYKRLAHQGRLLMN